MLLSDSDLVHIFFMKDTSARKSSSRTPPKIKSNGNGSHTAANGVAIGDDTHTLGKVESYLRSVIDHAYFGFSIVDCEGNLLLFNEPSGKRIHELAAEKNKSFSIGDSIFEIARPEFRERTIENVSRAAKGETVEMETPFTENGKSYWLKVNYSPICADGSDTIEAVCISTVDITSQKSAEDLLRKSDNDLRAIFSSISDSLLLVDRNLIVTAVNQAAQDRAVVHYHKQLQTGSSLLDVIEPERREAFKQLAETVFSGEEAEFEVAYRSFEGKSIWYLSHLNPVKDDAGVITGMVLSVTDITHRKETEQELQRKERLFRSVVLNIPGTVVIVVDKNHRFLLVEGDILEKLGYDRRSYEGKHPTEVSPPERYEASKDLYNRILAGEKFSLERKSEETGDDYMVHCVPLKDDSGEVYAGLFVAIDITDIKRAEETIRQSERRFRSLIEKGSDGIALCDAQANMTYLSPSTERMLGYDLEEMLRHSPWEFMHPNDVEMMQQVFMQLVSKPGNTMQAQWRKRHKNGTYRWLEGIGTNLLDDPALNAVVVNFRDVTDRKESEEYTGRLAAIVESSDDAIISKTLDGTVTSWNAAAERIYGYTAPEMVGQSITKLLPPDRLLEETAIIQRLRKGERVDHFQTKRMAKDGQLLDLSLTISPIRDSRGAIIGASNTARDVTEQKRMVEALRESEKKYRQLIEGLPIAIYTTDAQGKIMLYNDEAVNLWGREPEVGKDLWCGSWKIYDLDDNPVDLDKCPMALTLQEGKAVSGTEIIIERPDGTRRNVLPHPKPIFDANGRLTGAVNTLVDITDQKLAYQRLRESEHRFRTVADHAPVMIWMSQPDKKRNFFNKQWLEFTGRTINEEVGFGWAENIHPEDRERFLANYERSLDEHVDFRTEHRLRRHDGEYRWVSTYATPRYSPNKTFLGYVGAVTDITENKRAELTVRESEKRFRAVANTAPVMIWMAGTNKGCDFFNMGWLKFRGRTLEEELGDGWTQGLHPDDAEEARQTYHAAFDERKEFQLESRFKRYDGTYRWVVTNGVPRFDSDGSFLGYIGSCVDINDRKMLAEELERQVQERTSELRTKHEQLQQQKEFVDTILDTSVDSIVVIGKQLEYLAVNKKASTEWGKTKEEMLGKTITEVFPQFKRSLVLDHIHKALTGEELHLDSYRSEMNGHFYETFFIPLRDNLGQVYACLNIGHDITSIVEMTEQLKATNLTLEDKNQELVEQKKFVEKIIDASVDVITVIDNEGKYLAVNAKTEELYNVTREQLIGKRMIDVLPQMFDTETYGNLQKALSGEYVHTLMQRSVINNRIYENFFVPLTRNDKVYACLIIGHDNTFVIEVAEKLRSTNLILEERNKELARSNSDLEQFAYIASHDLQEPLRKIRMFSARLRETDAQTETSSPFVEKIISSAERMSDLINDLLNYSRLSHPEENFTKTNLNEIAKKVISDFDIVIQEKNATVTLEKLPAVDGIPLQINQLFHNLISNSLKFTRADVAPQINIRSQLLTREQIAEQHLNETQTYCQVEVEDNGIGFDQQYAEKIFVIFQRLNGKQEYKGTGIGLAICKKIVDTHRGRIYAEGKEGAGAIFRFILPIKQLPREIL